MLMSLSFSPVRGEKGRTSAVPTATHSKFFVLFGLLIFLGCHVLPACAKHFVSKDYWAGLDVVPVMMVADLCFGVFFNLSLWYKLTDRTQWGRVFLALLLRPHVCSQRLACAAYRDSRRIIMVRPTPP